MNRKLRLRLTLVELLTSLAIVALLAATLLPVLSAAQRKDNAELCLSNMKIIGSALSVYLQDYDEVMPTALVTSPPINGGNIDLVPYDMQLYPYLYANRFPQRNIDFFACPSDSTRITTDPTFALWNGKFRSRRYFRRSYSYAAAINTQARADSGEGQPDPNTGMSQWGRGNALAQMESPAETIALVEAWGTNEFGEGEAYIVGSPWGSILTNCDTWKLPGRNKPAQNPNDLPPGCEERFENPNVFPAAGHNGLGNYIFADSHVATRSWEQVRGNDFNLFKMQK